MSNRTAQAIRHVGFEDLGSFAGPIAKVGYQIDCLEAATHDLRSIDPLAGADLLVVDDHSAWRVAAHDLERLVLDRIADSLGDRLAAEAGRCRSRLTKLVALSCLAPDLVVMLLEGRQPHTLTAAKLLASPLPLAWSEGAARSASPEHLQSPKCRPDIARIAARSNAPAYRLPTAGRIHRA